MRKLTILLSLSIFALLILVGCSNQSKKGNYLPELKAEVPESLKGNTEAVSFIESTTDMLNEWSIAMEDLAVACEPYISKEESELTTMEKMKFGKIMMDFTANMGKYAVKMAEMEQTATMIEDGLNDQELEAMAAILETFEKRMQEINEKYADFGKEE